MKKKTTKKHNILNKNIKNYLNNYKKNKIY
jgi:hypothetical protein